MMEEYSTAEHGFNTDLAVQVWIRPHDHREQDWQELDRGPGYLRIPAGQEVSVRVHPLYDEDLEALVAQLADLQGLVALNLSENRNVTDRGLACLIRLPRLTELNLSSCSLTNTGLESLVGLSRLERLDLSYCNRLTDACVKSIRKLTALTYLDLKGCVKITNGGLSKLRRAGLTIHVK